MKAVFHAGKNDHGKRIDVILRKLYPAVPLSALSAALRKSHILIDGTAIEGKQRVHQGCTIVCTASFAREFHLPSANNTPQKAERPLIIARHRDFLVTQKPRGVLCEDFLVNVRATLPPSKDLSFLPSSVHQLDRNTSGLLLVACNIEGARNFSTLFHTRKILKEYVGIVCGRLYKPAVWTNKLLRDTQKAITRAHEQGKEAKTTVSPLMHWKKNQSFFSFLHYQLHTGRTHQIRIHSTLHDVPLAGDYKYGGGSGNYCLLAWRLTFMYGGSKQQFTAIITKEDKELMHKLGCKHPVFPSAKKKHGTY